MARLRKTSADTQWGRAPGWFLPVGSLGAVSCGVGTDLYIWHIPWVNDQNGIRLTVCEPWLFSVGVQLVMFFIG